jgi:beta-barrel assembly-enhancing protease
MKRRRWLLAGCAHCALWAGAGAGRAVAQGSQQNYAAPSRFSRPDIQSDEGGLWALMDREETRLRRSPFRMRDEALQDYLQALVCKLGGEHCADIRVYALRTPFFNASMAPNGMMQVWSGLLLRVDNEAQLAAVLAHEIAHFLQRHTLERLRDAKARSAFGTFLGMFGLVGALASLATLAGAFGFTRDQEREADQIGLGLMDKAGFDPREAAKVWDNLIAELSANPEADPGKSSPMFATHPASAERSRSLAALAEKAAAGSGSLGEEAYEARLAPWRFELLADELKRGRFDESLVLLQRMLLRRPQHAELLFYRGEAYRLRGKGGDVELALADLQAAATLGNEPAVTHRSLGYLHRGQARSDAARACFERYLEKTPNAADAALIRHHLTEGKPLQ